MENFTLALDWTPNANHTGFYVALEKGYYQDLNLSVQLRSPKVDDYKATPAKLLAQKQVDFAIAPSESVISYQTLNAKPNLIAIAAILQEDTSAIVTLKSSGIDQMKKLDGKKYASYDARFEDTIVSEMIKKDGGKGKHIKTTPAKLGIWESLLNGDADATWVFMPWEGIEAARKGIQLNAFHLKDFDIPYGYSPALLCHPDMLKNKEKAIKDFLTATGKGFKWAAQNPEEAAKILLPFADTHDLDFLIESQSYIAPYYLNPDHQWGIMQPERWDTFIHWLKKNELINKNEETLLGKQSLFSNKYL